MTFVSGTPGDTRHGDDSALLRRRVSRDDVLQVGDCLGSDGDRIDSLVGKGGMSAVPQDRHGERIYRGCAGTVKYCDLAELESRDQVAADDGIDTLEHAGRDELGGAPGRKLLGVLEEKANLAPQLRAPREQQAGDREQHRRMPVMPASVHDASGARGEVDSALLMDRKSVDVRPKRERAPRSSAAKTGNDARRGWALDLQTTERRESLANEPRRLVLMKRELRVGVQVPPPSNRVGYDLVQIHGASLLPSGRTGPLPEALKMAEITAPRAAPSTISVAFPPDRDAGGFVRNGGRRSRRSTGDGIPARPPW